MNAAAIRTSESGLDGLPGRDGVPLGAHQQHREPRAVRQSVKLRKLLLNILCTTSFEVVTISSTMILRVLIQ